PPRVSTTPAIRTDSRPPRIAEPKQYALVPFAISLQRRRGLLTQRPKPVNSRSRLSARISLITPVHHQQAPACYQYGQDYHRVVRRAGCDKCLTRCKTLRFNLRQRNISVV